MKLYRALQDLLERSNVTREDVDDLAVWATQELGRELVDRDRTPHDLLTDILERVLERNTTRLDGVKGPALVKALQQPSVATAVRLDLEGCRLNPKSVAALGALTDARELGLRRAGINPAGLAPLLSVIGHIERLGLGLNPLGDVGGDALAATELPALRALDVSGAKLSLEATARLVNAPVTRELRSFQTTLKTGAAKLGAVLARGTSLANLQGLRMYGTKLGRVGVAALVKDPVFRLRRLALLECGVGAAGCIAIAKSPSMSELEELRVRYDSINDAALIAICESNYVRSLRRLQMSQSSITPDGAAALAASGLPIEELDLSTNPRLGRSALQLFGKLTNLRQLILGGYRGGDLDVIAFAERGWFPHLETLQLSNNELTDKAIEALVMWPHFGKLRHLEIGTNAITDASIELIAKTPNRLESLEVYQTRVTTELPGVRMHTRLLHAPRPWA